MILFKKLGQSYFEKKVEFISALNHKDSTDINFIFVISVHFFDFRCSSFYCDCILANKNPDAKIDKLNADMSELHI